MAAWPRSEPRLAGGLIKPRIRSLPAALGSNGGELVKLAEALGFTLDPWQKLAVNDILATTDDGTLAAFEAVVVVARQCGKSAVAELYCLFSALKGETILFTAQRQDTAQIVFKRLLAVLPDEFGAVGTFTNGREQIALPGGGVILFRTRGPRVGRGMTLDKLVVDECQICDPEHLAATVPALRTRPNAQVLYLGCAPDARSNANCQILYELREQATRGDSESLCYLEWSAGFFDAEGVELQAHELTEEMLADERQWKQATPTERIPPERMRLELDAAVAKGNPVSFAIECLTVAIWPSGRSSAGPISLDAFLGLIEEGSRIAGDVPEVVVGYDMSPQRVVHVCIVGRRDDLLLHLDYMGSFEGAAKASAAICALRERDDVHVREVVFDGSAENIDLARRLIRDGIPKSAVRLEHAAPAGVQACGALVDAVAERKFRHLGQDALVGALRGAVAKPVGDSWAYSRSRSTSDVSPLLAAALALWGAEGTLPEEQDELEIF